MSRQINECVKELVDSVSKEANTGKAFEVKKYVFISKFLRKYKTNTFKI